jgi:hypothetical protein
MVLRERKRRRHALIRTIFFVTVAMLVAGGGSIPVTRWVIRQARRNQALQLRLDKRAESLGNRGFVPLKEWLDVPPAGVIASVERDTCSAVLAATEDDPGDTPIEVQRERTDPSTGHGGLVFCSCDAEQITIKVPDRGEKRTAVRLLNSRMADNGGVEVLLASSLSNFTIIDDDLSRGCAPHALEAWTKNPSHGAMGVINPKENSAASAYLREGMIGEGMVDSKVAFVALHAKAQSCYLAATISKNSMIYLRAPNGTRFDDKPASAIAFCTYGSDVALSIWRDKGQPSDIAVLRAPALKVGGSAGTRAVAMRNGHADARAILLPDDLTDDAKASLLSSTVQESTLVVANENGLPGKLDDRVAAFSLAQSASFLPEVSPRVPTVCLPSFAVSDGFRAFTCAQQHTQIWKANGNKQNQGAVEGRLPFWLSVLSDQSDAAALEATVRALAFAQRMTLLGFEPSTVDGVTDQPTGATVMGRPGKTEVVAVGITRSKPYLFPLSPSGATWALDSPIPIAPLAEGKTISLRSRASLGSDKASRRVVVFRR